MTFLEKGLYMRNKFYIPVTQIKALPSWLARGRSAPWCPLPAREGQEEDTDIWIRRLELEFLSCPRVRTVSVWVPDKQSLCRYFSSRNLIEETRYKNVVRVERVNGMWGNPEIRYNRKPQPPVGWKARERRWCDGAEDQGSPAGTLRERVPEKARPQKKHSLCWGCCPKQRQGELLWFLFSSHLPVSCVCLLLVESN